MLLTMSLGYPTGCREAWSSLRRSCVVMPRNATAADYCLSMKRLQTNAQRTKPAVVEMLVCPTGGKEGINAEAATSALS